MGSLGLPARAMAVRSAFALLCFALLCGLAVSSVVQSETETELTKKEDEAAGNEVLVEQAVESRVVRGTGQRNCQKNPKECKKCRGTWAEGKCRKPSKRTNNQEKRKACIDEGRKWDKDNQKCKDAKTGRSSKKNEKKEIRKCKRSGGKWENRKCVCPGNMRLVKKGERKGECVELQKKKLNRKTMPKAAKMESGRSTVNLTCLTKAIKLLKFQKDNVNNFLTRHTRQLKQNALSTKKQGKKGEFAEPAARLIQAGGGNKSNLTCGGSTTSAGAKQLLNLTTLLESCSADIHAACTPPSGINQTFMSECYDKSKGFNTTLTGCVTTALSGADPRPCLPEAKLVGAMTNLKSCKGKNESKLAAAARTKCLTQMRACNGYVEQAGRLQYTCKYTEDDLKKTLAQITANNATVAAAMDKVKALTGVEATDSSNSTNSSRRAREASHDEMAPMDAVQQLMGVQGRHLGKREIRAKRAVYTCASMTTAVQTCTTAVSDTPSGSTVISSCTIETTQTSITCTTEEKTALQTVSNTLLVAQRIFTAFAVSILSELSESAGATPSSTELTNLVNQITTGTSTKAASSRNRNMLRQMVLDKMKN